jgi:hypothetical protein
MQALDCHEKMELPNKQSSLLFPSISGEEKPFIFNLETWSQMVLLGL